MKEKFGQRSSLVTSTTCLMYFVASRNHLHKFYFTMKLNVWEVYKMKVNNCVRIQDYWQEIINVKLSIFNSRLYIPLLKGYFFYHIPNSQWTHQYHLKCLQWIWLFVSDENNHSSSQLASSACDSDKRHHCVLITQL